jgi:hypothetical protein
VVQGRLAPSMRARKARLRIDPPPFGLNAHPRAAARLRDGL